MDALLWFAMGVLSVLIAASARMWAQDLGLRMRWWKWLLAALWYAWCLLTAAAPLTLFGEGEREAALRLFAPMALVALILGVGLWRLLWRGRIRPAD